MTKMRLKSFAQQVLLTQTIDLIELFITLRCNNFIISAQCGGEEGIRTLVPDFSDHPISSRRRYDRFGTSPRGVRS